MARTDPTIYMRIPQELKDKLDAASAENRRSLTAEVVARLEATFDETVVTTVEARAKPGAQESRFEFNADEIAEKVVERLEGRKRTAAPNKVIIVGNLGKAPEDRLFGSGAYASTMYNILARSSPTLTPRGNEPYGPQRSPNAKKRPSKKSKE